METKIEKFKTIELSKGKTLQAYGSLFDPYFLAKDVAKLINHSDVSMMCARLDDDEKLIQTILVSGQGREVVFVSEYGLYEILMTSRTKVAKIFKSEIKKVLKSLRLNGGYLVGQSGFDQESFNRAVAERANCVVESMRRELNFWRAVANGNPNAIQTQSK